LEQPCAVFGDTAPSHRFVYKWFNEFHSGNRVSVPDLPQTGHQISKRTDGNISRVLDFITVQQKAVSRVCDALNLSNETERGILVDDLLFRKIC
jgi:hypothetical protein